MHLNLPDLAALADCRNVLIAGMGGGYDIFCGLPIYHELRRRGQNAHLANLSFAQLRWLKDGISLMRSESDDVPRALVGVTAQSRSLLPYFPELHLARHLATQGIDDATVWSFNAEGPVPLRTLYQTLIDRLQIDGLILVDGGVDSLLRGDESDLGTILEDLVTIAAVHPLPNLKTRVIACLGMGAERDIAYAHVFENIAALAEVGAMLGSCGLTRQMEAYQFYETALNAVQSQPGQDSSIINASITSAVQGHFGDYHATTRTRGSRLWISPLMPLYWFFDFAAVAERSVFLSSVLRAESRRQVLQTITTTRSLIPLRARGAVGLG